MFEKRARLFAFSESGISKSIANLNEQIVVSNRQRRRSNDNARLTIGEARQKMQKSIDALSDQLVGISAFGTSSLVDTVKVTYYGQKLPLKHLASFETSGRRINIKAFDPTILSTIAKACQNAGFNACVFSKEAVVVQLPDLSGDTREETKARVRRLGEAVKVAVRNVRKQFRQALPKELPKSEKQAEENAIQAATDEAIRIIDRILMQKSACLDR